MTLTGLNYIRGEGVSSPGKTFHAVNPETDEIIRPSIQEASKREIELACRAANSASQSFGQLKPRIKAGFLEGISQEIEALGDELIERAGLETALPQARLIGERGRTVNQIRMFAALVREGSWVDARIDLAQPDRKPIPRPDLRRMLRPIGPVAIFGASNFPLAFSVAGGDTASALAGGNPVVVKANPAHPGTSELVAKAIISAIAKAGIDPGVFSLLQGMSHQVGTDLVCHPLIKAVGFTGSLRGGRSLFNSASNREEPIPVFAEMGSINPVFVLPEALAFRPREIAKGLHQSVTLGVGQFCTNPGIVILPESSGYEDFQDELSELTKGWNPFPMLHSGICSTYTGQLRKFSDIPGVEVLAKSREPGSEESGNLPVAAVLTVTSSEFIKNPNLSEEIFGPATIIIRCADISEMDKIADSFRGHLTASIHFEGREIDSFQPIIRILEDKVGRIVFNGFPTGVEVCPSMHHGGPYPATTDSRMTSVGTAAIQRFVRPICYQDSPERLLPDELKNQNSLRIWRLVENQLTKDDTEETAVKR